MDQLGLGDQERELVALLKAKGRIDNNAYQEAFGVTKPTASRHLEALLGKGILRKIGTTGKGTYYVLSRKGLKVLMTRSFLSCNLWVVILPATLIKPLVKKPRGFVAFCPKKTQSLSCLT